MSDKRYGFLRTVIFEDKKRKETIFKPIFSDNLAELEGFYDQCIKEHFDKKRYFNEVAIFDYEKCSYVSNNFSTANYYRRYIRGEVI